MIVALLILVAFILLVIEHRITKGHKKLMSALENLTAAIARNTAAVDAVIEAWNKPNATEEQIQAAADAVNAQAARLETLVAPPPVV